MHISSTAKAEIFSQQYMLPNETHNLQISTPQIHWKYIKL